MNNNRKKDSRPQLPALTGSLPTILKAVALALCLVLLGVTVAKRAGQKVPSSAGENTVEQPVGPLQVEADPVQELTYPRLVVSELMPSNKSSLLSDTGAFSDWVELCNTGSEALELSDYKISVENSKLDISGTLQPGEYTVVFCSGKLPAEGGTVSVADPSGALCQGFEYAAVEKDSSVCWSEEGLTYTDFISPGYENGDGGYEGYQSDKTAGSLVINEVMVYNDSLLRTQDYGFYDWVELKNTSSAPIQLSDYYLSDSNTDHLLFRLPEATLEAGGLYIIYCVGDEELAKTNIGYAPFGLDALRDKLYVTGADGTLSDYTPLRQIPTGGSYGRLGGEHGFFFFSDPTPGYENSNGVRSITQKPVCLTGDGVFNDVTSVTVELAGEGDIYYSIGSSMPTTSSIRYTGPFTVDETCVVRAISVAPGKLTGEALSLSYIINENHTLPVVSLVTPKEDWEMVYYSPAKDFERECTAEYFGDDGRFYIDCGFKLHGETSRSAEKKSLKLQFKSRYDGKLKYDVFGKGITEYSSILLRAAQEDTYSTQMRDALMHKLAIAAFPELPAQDYKYAVLYVNGEFWGTYNIREAHSVEHFANHYGVTASTVEMYREDVNVCPELSQVYKFMLSNPVSNDSNYAQVEEQLNIDSVIGWTIIQAYSGNIDCFPNNVRMYYSPETGKVSYALLDLDLGMFGVDAFGVAFDTTYRYTDLARGLTGSKTYRTKLLEQLSAALTGPLSNENVLAAIDEMAAQLDPEKYDDISKWGGTYVHWQQMVEDLKSWVTSGDGRAAAMAKSAKSNLGMTDAEYTQYFGNVK